MSNRIHLFLNLFRILMIRDLNGYDTCLVHHCQIQLDTIKSFNCTTNGNYSTLFFQCGHF